MPSGPAAPSPWIISARADLLFVWGTPVLCLLTILPLAAVFSPEAVWAVALTVGATGHHLPGFLRAYGDRALFLQHRSRFLIAPPLVLGAALLASFWNFHALALIALVWSIWHGLMQHYGVLRIYDAKSGAPFALGRARLDWALTLCWFAVCLVFSPNETGSLLEALYSVGAGPVPAGAFAGVRAVVGAVTAVVVVLYAVQVWRGWRAGSRLPWIKLGLLLSTSAFVWFARVVTTDPFLSAALFEVLHDVQYLALVWAFGRRRVSGGTDGSRLSAAIFRPGVARVCLYVGLCLAYGSLAFVALHRLPDDPLRKVLLALFATSGILHFYFDGFIWKLQQPQTRQGLDLTPVAASVRAPSRWRELAHLAAFVIPFAAALGLQTHGPPADAVERARAVVDAAPARAASWNALGVALLNRDDAEAALPTLHEALRLHPDSASVRANLADALWRRGDLDGAMEQVHAALAIRPRFAEARVTLGNVLVSLGRREEAIPQFEEAVRLGHRAVNVHNNLGDALLVLGRKPEALVHFEAAVGLDPDSSVARRNLALALHLMGRSGDAIPHLTEAVRLNPANAQLRTDLETLHRLQVAHSPP